MIVGIITYEKAISLIDLVVSLHGPARVLALWWRTLRRRSQKRRISWTRILELAQRWLPQPRALHPFPDARFAATHPR